MLFVEMQPSPNKCSPVSILPHASSKHFSRLSRTADPRWCSCPMKCTLVLYCFALLWLWICPWRIDAIYCHSLELPWWRHQVQTFSTLLALCAGNSPVTGEFPEQRPVTRCFDVFFDLRLKTQLSKQWRRRRFETPARSLWRHNNSFTGIRAIRFLQSQWSNPKTM